MNVYQELIADITGLDGRVLAHVQAWMLLEHPTLNGLPLSQFRSEVKIAQACIAASSDQENEQLAKSYGL